MARKKSEKPIDPNADKAPKIEKENVESVQSEKHDEQKNDIQAHKKFDKFKKEGA